VDDSFIFNCGCPKEGPIDFIRIPSLVKEVMLISKLDVPKYQILRREDLISPSSRVKSFNESVSQLKGPAKQKGQKQ
jgi:hypothetical protein